MIVRVAFRERGFPLTALTCVTCITESASLLTGMIARGLRCCTGQSTVGRQRHTLTAGTDLETR
jgi:hypothetical protein